MIGKLARRRALCSLAEGSKDVKHTAQKGIAWNCQQCLVSMGMYLLAQEQIRTKFSCLAELGVGWVFHSQLHTSVRRGGPLIFPGTSRYKNDILVMSLAFLDGIGRSFFKFPFKSSNFSSHINSFVLCTFKIDFDQLGSRAPICRAVQMRVDTAQSILSSTWSDVLSQELDIICVIVSGQQVQSKLLLIRAHLRC